MFIVSIVSAYLTGQLKLYLIASVIILLGGFIILSILEFILKKANVSEKTGNIIGTMVYAMIPIIIIIGYKYLF